MTETFVATIGDTEIEHNHTDPLATPGFVGNIWKDRGECPACDALRDQANEEHHARMAKVREPEPDPTTPALKGTIEVTCRVTQDVNILAYFQTLNEYGQKAYANLTDVYDEFERPFQYLLSLADEAFGGVSLLGYRDGITASEWVEPDDEGDIRVTVTTGSPRRFDVASLRWDVSHFDILRANVPWLDAFHRELEADDEEEDYTDEERDEMRAESFRVPGPNDEALDL